LGSWPPAFSSRVVAAILAAAFAACQPLPRPFQSEGPPELRAPLLVPDPSAAILIAPVQGAPAAKPLADQVARKLRQRGIVAGTETASRSSHAIWGAAEETPGRPGSLTLRWRLLNPQGHPSGQAEQVVAIDRERWQAGSPDVLAAVAEQAAPVIEGLLGRQLAAAPPPLAAPAPAVAAVKRRQLAIRWVDGAPGDGDIAMARAMRVVLDRRRVALSDLTAAGAPGATGGDYVLVGRASVKDGRPGQQDVAIDWTLRRADGADLATVSQRNALPKGRLDGPWGEVAAAAAEASADALIEILRNLPDSPAPR
jgi:hypothetical protein